MDEATQQNTQPVDHLQTKGASSILKTQDEADILCLLTPASLPAHKAVDLVLQSTPQHIHMSYGNGHFINSAPDGNTNNELENSNSDESELVSPNARVTSPGIALRMSSQVRDRRMGFVFGRNLDKCDLLMAKDSMKLSSAHFRVYVNHGGVLMLEDMSKNGTYVDHNLLKSLKADPPNHGLPSTRMLSQGSIIELPVIAEKNEEWIRFIVLFPTRKNGEEVYQLNLVGYIEQIKQDERKAQIARAARGPLPATGPMPFTPLLKKARAQSPPSSTITAATGQNNYGMKWNGGETYNVVGYIGQGAFAMVYKLSTVQDGSVYACKQIEKRRFVKDGQPGHKMHDEIRIMESISHPNIVQFIDSHETSRYMFIIMDYIPLGDLTVYINNNSTMYEHMGQHVAAQICQALKYLHEHKIAHRDIKPDNVLVAGHNPFVFKLSDFGLSKIVSSENYMRTFCGTILYCAPEIYPGYERAKAGMPVGKRGRHIQHPREETRPYYYSVDTWGIAAVLFHLLSGQPAWAGTTDDNGAVMLETIFSIPIDWDRLALVGLSELAVDFIKGMLQIDPADRATDEEILAHPWIKELVLGRPANLHEELSPGKATTHDDEDLPDASQLDISDKHGLYGLDGTNEREHDEVLDEEDELVRNPNRVLHPSYTTGPMLAIRDAPARHQANTRLFGEIPESALQSSGVLGQNVNEALDIEDPQIEELDDHECDSEMEGLDMEGYDEDYDHESHPEMESLDMDAHDWYYLDKARMREIHEAAAAAANAAVPIERDEIGHSHITSVEPSLQGPDWNSAESDSDINSAADDTENAPYRNFPPNLNTLDAVSLYGTESLAEGFNMAPPRHPNSSAQASKVTSSQSTTSGNKSAAAQSKRSNQHFQPAADAPSNKRSKTEYKASSEHQPHNKRASKETQPTRASRRLSNKAAEDTNPSSGEGANAEEIAQDDDEGDEKIDSSFEMHEVSKTVTHGYRIRTDPDELWLAIAAQEKFHKAHPELLHPGKEAFLKEMMAKRYVGPPLIDAYTGPNLNTFAYTYAKLQPYDLDTPIPLGILTPTEGSIPTVAAITITNRTTTFGRDPAKNTFVHPGDPNTDNWERVGKNCIDLTFWYCNIEKEIDDKTLPTEWYKNPDLICLISTRTTRYILVNGVKLTKASLAWHYGKLRTGDIVTVVTPDPGREPKNESETKFLSFRCEFFVGASKDPRPEDGSEPFKVESEQEEYFKNNKRIATGFSLERRKVLRDRLIAEGRDPDAEQAVKLAKRRELQKARREREAAEEAGHMKRMRDRGLISPEPETAAEPETVAGPQTVAE